MVVGEIALEDSKGVIGAGEGVEGLEVEELDIGIGGGIAAEHFEFVIECGDLHVVGALDSPTSIDEFFDEEELVIVARLEGEHLSVLDESESLGMFCGEEVEGFRCEAVFGGILGGGGEAGGGFAASTELAVGRGGALAGEAGGLGRFRCYDCYFRGL